MYPKGKSRGRVSKFDSSLQLASVMGAGANKIKKQIRNVERLLQKKRDVLPDTVLLEKERTLEALKLELQEAEMRQVTKRNAKKYHMVRFFERKKALRRYNQTLKDLKSDPANKKLNKDLEEREIDLCYVVNFPKTTKYIALYPTTEESTNEGETKNGTSTTETKRNTYREIIIKQLRNNQLPVSLEEILKGKILAKDEAGVSLEDDDVRKGKDGDLEESDKNDESEDDFFE